MDPHTHTQVWTLAIYHGTKMFCGPSRVRKKGDPRDVGALWGKSVKAIRYQEASDSSTNDRRAFLNWCEAVESVIRAPGVRVLRGPMGSGDGKVLSWSDLSHADQREKCNMPFMPSDRNLRGAEAQTELTGAGVVGAFRPLVSEMYSQWHRVAGRDPPALPAPLPPALMALQPMLIKQMEHRAYNVARLPTEEEEKMLTLRDKKKAATAEKAALKKVETKRRKQQEQQAQQTQQEQQNHRPLRPDGSVAGELDAFNIEAAMGAGLHRE